MCLDLIDFTNSKLMQTSQSSTRPLQMGKPLIWLCRAWKPPVLMPWRTSERQEMTLAGGSGCLELVLYIIRGLTKHQYDLNQSEHSISTISINENSILRYQPVDWHTSRYRGESDRESPWPSTGPVSSQAEVSGPCWGLDERRVNTGLRGTAGGNDSCSLGCAGSHHAGHIQYQSW